MATDPIILPSGARAGAPTASPTLAEQLRSTHTDERDRAWRALYDDHFDRVYRLVCRFGVEPGEVEDLTQRAFVIAFRRIGEVDDVRDPGAWLRGIVVRVVSQHRRWRRVRDTKRWLLRDTRAAAPQPIRAPDRSVAAAQELANIRRVLAKMSAKLSDVLVLCDIEQCTPAEVSSLLGIPVNTVRSRRRSARAKFTALWRREFGGEP